MSKIYNNYLELKKQNDEKMYLFRCGNFYIFLNEDAHKINEYVTLKITYFATDATKCGFPVASFSHYEQIFAKNNLDVEVIEEVIKGNASDFYLKKIHKLLDNISIDEMKPIEAMNMLVKVKEILNDKQ